MACRAAQCGARPSSNRPPRCVSATDAVRRRASSSAWGDAPRCRAGVERRSTSTTARSSDALPRVPSTWWRGQLVRGARAGAAVPGAGARYVVEMRPHLVRRGRGRVERHREITEGIAVRTSAMHPTPEARAGHVQRRVPGGNSAAHRGRLARLARRGSSPQHGRPRARAGERYHRRARVHHRRRCACPPTCPASGRWATATGAWRHRRTTTSRSWRPTCSTAPAGDRKGERIPRLRALHRPRRSGRVSMTETEAPPALATSAGGQPAHDPGRARRREGRRDAGVHESRRRRQRPVRSWARPSWASAATRRSTA